MVMNVTKISQKKKVSWSSIDKNTIKWEKTLYYNYKKTFLFRRFYFFLRESIRNIFFVLVLEKFSLNKEKM